MRVEWDDGIMQLSNASIDTMERRRHDLEYQYRLVGKMMKGDKFLPYPFERAVILLVKDKRFEEALAVCEYIKDWCAQKEAEYDIWLKRGGYSVAMNWKSPRLQKCIDRIPQLRSKIA